MSLCERPGCLAEAVLNGRCRIHAFGLGALCNHCGGSGWLYRVGRAERDVCDACGGCGLRDERARAPRVSKKVDPVDRRGLIRRSEEN